MSNVASKKVVIISSFDEECGIAYNASAIKHILENEFDVTVFKLEQFLYRSSDPILRKIANKNFDQFLKRIRNEKFDLINVQFEPGIFGSTLFLQWPRLLKLMWTCRARKVIFTMHNMLSIERVTTFQVLKAFLKRRNFHHMLYRFILPKINAAFFWLLKTLQFYVQVHNYNNQDELIYLKKFNPKKVITHPLTYFTQNEAELIHKSARPLSKKGYINLGIFGFLSPYKGIDEILEIMPFLPKHFLLHIFGGVHLGNQNNYGKGKMDLYLHNLIKRVKKLDLIDRVFFHGPLSDDDMAQFMSSCDIVILSYADTGQVASGPTTMAIELGKQVVVTNSKLFDHYEAFYGPFLYKYNKNSAMQLVVNIITASTDLPRKKQVLPYNPTTLLNRYKEVCGI